jgi:hypothetical protein
MARYMPYCTSAFVEYKGFGLGGEVSIGTFRLLAPELRPQSEGRDLELL